MDSSHIPRITPQQEEGVKKDLEEHVMAESQDDAEEMFVTAKNRLLNVNQWHEYAGVGSATFKLTDEKGYPLTRTARKGDYIKVDIPGPGSVAGEGKDWVVIETIQYDDYPDTNMEILAMRVRTTSKPGHETDASDHFFKAGATSTFSVQRRGSKILATYNGRNETPNVEADNLIDKARNAVVAIGAMLGLSDVQWQKLIKGFVEFDDIE
jgi:hypothetical protein